MSLTPPETVGKLQATLHAKAKGSPSYRFYALYDKVYRTDVLGHAHRSCQKNDGAAGVDGQTFEDIEKYGVQRWLDELAEELRTKRYRPEAVRRVLIPKPGQPGRTRPLGIPTIKDRVVMTAAVLVLDPIFEVDLQPEQYAYRSERSAQDAVRQVHALLKARPWEVIDADLSGYFDSIPHFELMKSVARRVSDRSLLGLIKTWLQAPVEETDERGRKCRTTRNKDEGRGCPQGAPITPPTILRRLVSWTVSYLVRGSDRATGRNGRQAGSEAAFCNAFFKEVSRHGRFGAAVGAAGGAFVCPLAFG